MGMERDDWDDDERTPALGSAMAVADMTDMWLRAASQYRLLTAEEEVRAGKGQRVCACCDSPQQALVNHNLRLVVSTAKGYKAGATSFAREDIWQAGAMGLMTAAQKWDAGKGFKFSTYATWWIRQAISRHLTDYGYTVREPIYRHARRNQALRAGEEFEAMLIPVSLDEPARQDDPESGLLVDLQPDPQAPDPAVQAERADTREQLRAAMRDVLTTREQLVLTLRYGLDDTSGLTLEEAGRQLGVTRERVRQIEAKAFEKLRLRLDYDVKDGLRRRRLRKRADVVHYEQPAAPTVTAPAWTPPDGPRTVKQAKWDRWYAEHREARNAKRRARRLAHRAAAVPVSATPQQPARQTRRPAPDVSSPATGRETREPHVSQQSQTVTKQSRRRAPSRSSAPASAEVVVVVPASIDVLPAVGVTGPDMTVSAGKRTTATPRLTRGDTKTKQTA